MLPAHNANGLLPVGIHEGTWAEVVARFGGSAVRERLLAGLHAVVSHLAAHGCTAVYLGGGFVTTKATTKDVDVVWQIEGVDIDGLNPVFLGPDGMYPLMAHFGVHLFPSMLIEGASGKPFVEFFQTTRDGEPVGVVKLDLATLEG